MLTALYNAVSPQPPVIIYLPNVIIHMRYQVNQQIRRRNLPERFLQWIVALQIFIGDARQRFRNYTLRAFNA